MCHHMASMAFASIATANTQAPNRPQDISCANADLSSVDSEKIITNKNSSDLTYLLWPWPQGHSHSNDQNL